MGASICKTQKKKTLDLAAEIKKFELIHATSVTNKNELNNESMVQGNRDAYYSDE